MIREHTNEEEGERVIEEKNRNFLGTVTLNKITNLKLKAKEDTMKFVYSWLTLNDLIIFLYERDYAFQGQCHDSNNCRCVHESEWCERQRGREDILKTQGHGLSEPPSTDILFSICLIASFA